MISEILVLARVDAEQARAEPVDLDAVLQSVHKDAQHSAPEQQILLHHESGLSLQGWPTLIERALDNLLRNALRFNPPGQPIEITAVRDNERIVLSVRDHGPGVAEEHLAQLGEPFFRAPGQSAAGHGLGLAIARKAAERHGGSLTLENHPQGGFVARLELPLTGPGVL
ncbi:Sensor protein QseC [compost metagenome]